MKCHPRRRLGRAAVCAACLCVSASCGDAGPGIIQLSDDQSHEVRGVVVDGYLEGAQVFLDLNENHELDADEPSDVTDASGAFHLTVHGVTSAQLAATFLHASVPDSAKDADDHGATLKEAGKRGFTLLAPMVASSGHDAGVSANVVSPLSALVAGEMLGSGLDLEAAKQTVQARLGLSGKDLLQDFVATPDAVLNNVARAAALSLGETSRAADAHGDAGVEASRGDRVVEALTGLQQDLPKIVMTLGLLDPTAAVGQDAVKSEWARAQDDRRALDGGMAAALADGGMREPPKLPSTSPEPTRDAAIHSEPEHHDGAAPDAAVLKLPEGRGDARDAAVLKLPSGTGDAHDAAVIKLPESLGDAHDAAVIKLPEGLGDAHDAGLPKPPLSPEQHPDAGLVPPPSSEPKRALDAGVGPSTELHGDAGPAHDGGVSADLKRL
ncbi:MAG: hypothetical protein JWN48_901 [Myxococcaceae bacterium]|nr:hypothetical protein [Myxococcaceae bacterium]